MRRYFGRNNHKKQQFSKENEQILALNYENLCDDDYLHRLFVDDYSIPKEDEIEKGASEASMKNFDFAEDIIIFGNDARLGQCLYNIRTQLEVNQTVKSVDNLSFQINKQVIVFEHMADFVVQKILARIHDTSTNSKTYLDDIQQSTTSTFYSHVIELSLYAVENGNEGFVNPQILLPLVLSLKEFFGTVVQIPHEGRLRDIFMQACFIMSKPFDINSWSKKSFEEDTKSILLGVFGFLSLGLLSNDVTDIIVAIDILAHLIITTESNIDQVLKKLKDSYGGVFTMSVNSHIGASSRPIKHSSKSKLATKSSAQNYKDISQSRQRSNNANDSTLESCRIGGLTTSESQKSHTSKLWEKSGGGKLFENQKDLNKNKLNAAKVKESKLYAYLDSKETIANQPLIPTNNAQINYSTESITSDLTNIGVRLVNNNHDFCDRKDPIVYKELSQLSPRTNLKKMEREIRNSHQLCLKVPNAILYMLNKYCLNLTSSATATVIHSAHKVQSNFISTKVWSCGQNSYGELGLNDINMRKSFARISFLDDKDVVSIGAGNEHSLFVTEGGKLYASGYNDNGQCGTGSNQQVRQPALVHSLEDEEIFQVHVYNGCEHTLALTKEGKIFSFGYNYRGQLGLGNTNSEFAPRPIRALMSRKVVLAGCSYHHSVFLCSDGTVFSCGRNDSGQLGHGDTVDKKTPQAILSAPRQILSISCGQFHTVLSTSLGQVFVCGKNDYGQLGIESTNNVKVFTKLPMQPEIDNIFQVCCGYYHTLILTNTGIVAGFGRNDYGQLGFGHSQPKVYTPTIIAGLRDKGVIMLAAGCYHSITVTSNGMLYVFGRNNHGQLATGDLEERHNPHPIDDFVGQKILSVSAGFYHTLVLTSESVNSHNVSFDSTHTQLAPTCVRAELFLDSAAPKDCSKHQALNLRKDLELITGFECNEATLLAVQSSVDLLSSVTCRELLVILIKNVNCFVPKDVNLKCLGRSRLEGALSSVSSLFQMSWKIICGNNSQISVPLSSPDAVVLIKRLLPITDQLLSINRSNIVHSLEKILIEKTHLDEHFESKLNFFNGSFEIFPERDISLPKTIFILRNTILQIYFDYYDIEMANNEGEPIIMLICDTLLHGFEIFFYHPKILANLLEHINALLISGKVENINKNVKDLRDPAKLLKLLTIIGKVYFRFEECLKLCASSIHFAVKIFRSLLNLFNYYSIHYCVERKFNSNNKSVDVRRVTTVLEQTLSNLLKSILPFIFSTEITEHTVDCSLYAAEVVNDMLRHSNGLLEVVLQQQITDEILGSLRYGTVLPSLLPTTLLFVSASAKNGLIVTDILSNLLTLIEKLQLFCRYEVSIAQLKAKNCVLTCDNGHDAKKDFIIGSSVFVNTMEKTENAQVNDILIEEALYWRKDCSQISWWFRLLKLSIHLMTTMNFGRSAKKSSLIMRRFTNATSTIDVKSFESLFDHELWNYCGVQIDKLSFRLADANFFQTAFVSLAPTAAKAITHVYRCIAKETDGVYRMLVQSSLKNNCWGYFEFLEEILFDTATSIFGYRFYNNKILYKNITKITKFIFSRRSMIVSSDESKCWHDSILSIVNVYREITLFIKTCCDTSRSSSYFPLLLPFRLPKNDSQRRWRLVVTKILCAKRWYRLLKMSVSLPLTTLNYIHSAVLVLTKDFTNIPSANHLTEKMETEIYRPITLFNEELSLFGEELSESSSILRKVSPFILRLDILLQSTALLIDETTIEDDDPLVFVGKMSNSSNMWNVRCYDSVCYSSFVSKLRAFQDDLVCIIETSYHNMVSSDISNSPYSVLELQHLGHAFKLLESLHYSSKLRSFRNYLIVIDSNIVVKLISYYFDKYSLMAIFGDDKSPQSSNLSNTSVIGTNTAKKSICNSRERINALKKLILGMMSYWRTAIFSKLEQLNSYANEELQLQLTIILNCYNKLLWHLQQHRNKELFSSNSLGSLNGESANCENNSSHVGKPVMRDTMNNRKRCQDIITKPIEFSRQSEGVLILGEKLLNNCKGVDYSITTWIYLLNKPAPSPNVANSSPSYFLLGKLNHNEAWPLLFLKSDGKLEVLYGHHNECEKVVSEASIPLYTWTHITIVIEQKKIKLFINSQLDSTINTAKGNSKSILFPLLISSCPTTFKTKINSVKLGFDGMLSHCKYYSRALSPIHIKVIFDHGPPEAIDLSAKLIYIALSSFKCILQSQVVLEYCSRHSFAMKDLISETVRICINIYTLDQNRRNRSCSLQIVRCILLNYHSFLRDITLTGLNYHHIDGTKLTVDSCFFVSVFDCPLLPQKTKSIYTNFIYYILRIIGSNWLQSVLPITLLYQSEQSFVATIKLLLKYVPRCAWCKDIQDYISLMLRAKLENVEECVGEESTSRSHISQNSFAVNEKLASLSEGNIGEIGFHFTQILHELVSKDFVWRNAMIEVIDEIFSNFQDHLGNDYKEVKDLNYGWLCLDLIAVSNFLGGVSTGLFLGCKVLNNFNTEVGTIIFINNSTNNVVVLSENVKSSKEFFHEVKLSKLKTSDLILTDHFYESSVLDLIPKIFEGIIRTLDGLSPYLRLLSKDYISMVFNDCYFQHKSLLPLLSPTESYIYVKLINCISHFYFKMERSNLILHERFTNFRGYLQLEQLMEDVLSSTRNNPSNRPFWGYSMKKFSNKPDCNEESDQNSICSVNSNRTMTLANKWFTNLQSFVLISNSPLWQTNIVRKRGATHHSISFPAEQDEVHFFDFMHKSIGLQYEKSVRRFFYQYGLFYQLLFNSPRPNTAALIEIEAAEENNATVSAYVDFFGEERCHDVISQYKSIIQENNQVFPDSNSSQHALSYYSYIRALLQKSCSIVGPILLGRKYNIDEFTVENVMLWIALRPVVYTNADYRSMIYVNFNSFHTSTRECYESNILKWKSIAVIFLNHGEDFVKVTELIVSTIRFMMTTLLEEKHYLHQFNSCVREDSMNQNFLINTNNFDTLLYNLYYWLELCYNELCLDKYQCIIKTIIPFLLEALCSPRDQNFQNNQTVYDVLELKYMQLCCFALRTLISKICRSEIMESLKLEPGLFLYNKNFLILRGMVQRDILKYEGPNNLHFPIRHTNYLTTIVSNMELIQRYCSMKRSVGDKFHCFKSSEQHLFSRLSTLVTNAPIITLIESDTINIDLEESSSTLSSLVDQSMEFNSKLVRIEVALAIGIIDKTLSDDDIFETIYSGTNYSLKQVNLLPGVDYTLRCRCFYNGFPLLWSDLVYFKTTAGTLFQFDRLKCGQEIQISDDGLTATYNGDDNWNTVLGTRSFSSGTTSWEVKIVQSSTAYIFIGIATSMVDLHTFLGGCSQGWGFIGEQALYHNREKVKVYGESFSAGDIIKVEVDLSLGYLSYSKNGKFLGCAFEKIYGDMYPAVAFYNMGQVVQIMSSETKPSKCIRGSFSVTPFSNSCLYNITLFEEISYYLYWNRSFGYLSYEVAELVCKECNHWCNPQLFSLVRTISQQDIYLLKVSSILEQVDLVVGDKVRTNYGIAEVAGVAFHRVWFHFGNNREVWFFTIQQILEGKSKKYFLRSTYQFAMNDPNLNSYPHISVVAGSINELSEYSSKPNQHYRENVLYITKYDVDSVAEMLDPKRWTSDMDKVLLNFLLRLSESNNVEPMEVTIELVLNNFRILQSQLTRVVLNNTELTHCWGISGPKRKAVIARLSLLKIFNHYAACYLPILISDPWCNQFECNKPVFLPDFTVQIETLWIQEKDHDKIINNSLCGELYAAANDCINDVDDFWAPIYYSWDDNVVNSCRLQELWGSPFHSATIRKCLLPLTKLRFISEILKKTATLPSRTEDEYDYPENLPHVKINRLKALRVREACELLQLSADDIFFHTLFCQFWKELAQFNYERLRISYTHPMDDGQSRTFKVKFEGEGVDDYGGPYRELFQQVFYELQLLEKRNVAVDISAGMNCFLPLLMPIPNWLSDEECSERYCFMFDPRNESFFKRDLYKFFGQLLGIVIRSKITIDLSFPSFIWKCIVGESVSEVDLASFDQSSYDMILRLKGICCKVQLANLSTDDMEALQAEIVDLTWSVRRSDGSIIELIPNGSNISVNLAELGAYLSEYMNTRFSENKIAIQLLRKGLFSIIPQSVIGILTWEELRSLICGAQIIDITRLQDNTEYDDDLTPRDSHIQYFWEVLKEFSEDEKAAFLKFVWARSSLPPKGVEFSQKMRILNMVNEDPEIHSSSLHKQDILLPKAHTCFFSINLPKYSTKEILAEKLRYAIINCTEMDGDFRVDAATVPGWGGFVNDSMS